MGGFRSAEPSRVWMERVSHGKGQAAWKEVGRCGLKKGKPSPSMGFSAWFLPLCLQKLAQSCVLPQRDVKLQPVNESTLVPVQGNLFAPYILTSASHLEK